MSDIWRAIKHPQQFWQTSAVREIWISISFLVCIFLYINLYLFVGPIPWLLKPPISKPPDRRYRRQKRWLDCSPRPPRRALSFYKVQERSLFLSVLPLEIRQEIYKYVLCGRVKHFARLGHHDAILPQDFELNGVEYRAYDSVTQLFNKNSKDDARMLPLILSCHQIYTEAVDILYKSLVFKVSRLFTLHDIFMTLPRQRFAAIRRLELNYEFRCGLPMVRNTRVREDSDWERFWILAAKRMPSLRYLKVDLFNFDVPGILSPDQKIREKWLLPILGVRNLEHCMFKLHHARKLNVLLPDDPPAVSAEMKNQLWRLEQGISQALVTDSEGAREALVSGESWY